MGIAAYVVDQKEKKELGFIAFLDIGRKSAGIRGGHAEKKSNLKSHDPSTHHHPPISIIYKLKSSSSPSAIQTSSSDQRDRSENLIAKMDQILNPFARERCFDWSPICSRKSKVCGTS
ncbi:hypothetical protein ACFXTH_016555 [Malus domestica]